MRPIRHVRPGSVYEITTRTIDRTLLLRPSKEVNRIILGVIGRAQEQTGVKIYGLVFMSTQEEQRMLCEAYAEASHRFRAKEWDVAFPAGTFRPGGGFVAS